MVRLVLLSLQYTPEELARDREALINSLKREGILKSKSIEGAFRAIPRERFLWPGSPPYLAYSDEPQPLGDTGQTVSAPHMVAIMLEELELAPGMKVLEVGCGSGYNAALLGWLVSRDKPGKQLVTSIERDERLVKFARENISRIELSSIVEIVVGDGSLGYPEASEDEMYDRIVVTAGARQVPPFLKRQLDTGAILLVPVGPSSIQKLLKIRKKRTDEGVKYEEQRLTDCMFVPLVSQHG